MKYTFYYIFILFIVCSCTSTTPKNTDNICKVFKEKDDWYADAKASYEKWGLPIHINMAIMHQESRFVADAQPPRPKLLGFIPWFRSVVLMATHKHKMAPGMIILNLMAVGAQIEMISPMLVIL